MKKTLYKIEEQYISLSECSDLLAIFTEFMDDEGYDIEQNREATICFLRRLPMFLSLLAVVHGKIIDAHDALRAIVEEGVLVTRKEKVAGEQEGACA